MLGLGKQLEVVFTAGTSSEGGKMIKKENARGCKFLYKKQTFNSDEKLEI